MSNESSLLELKNIKKYFPVEKGISERILGTGVEFVHAVDDISLEVQENEVVGLCGESGCGKTTTARVIAGLDFETAGYFKWKGETLTPNERRNHSFRKKIQFIFQNPFQSLNPRMKVGHQVLDALIIQNQFDDPERKKYVNQTKWGLILGLIFMLVGIDLIFFAYPETPIFVLPTLLSTLMLVVQMVLLVLIIREIYYLLDYCSNIFIWLLNIFVNKIVYKRKAHYPIPSTNLRKTYQQKIVFFVLFFLLVVLIGFDSWQMIKIQNLIPAINLAVSFASFRIIFLLVGPVLMIVGAGAYFYLNYRPKLTYMDKTVLSMFQSVGLVPADTYYQKYPHQLSGGERQRVVIARALILNPKLVVADEPTSMLDVSIRASILDLISKMKELYSLSVLFITHDLATVSQFCDKVAIMYVGEIVEKGNIEEIFRTPRHPYTWSLIKAIPVPDPSYKMTGELPIGDVADAINPPSGCRFNPRCQFAKDRCRTEVPILETVSPKQSVACHFQEELWSNGSLKID